MVLVIRSRLGLHRGELAIMNKKLDRFALYNPISRAIHINPDLVTSVPSRWAPSWSHSCGAADIDVVVRS